MDYPLDLVDDDTNEQYWSFGHHDPDAFIFAVNRYELAAGMVERFGESAHEPTYVQHRWGLPFTEYTEIGWTSARPRDPGAVPVTVLPM
jgi:hypothetical protein